MLSLSKSLACLSVSTNVIEHYTFDTPYLSDFNSEPFKAEFRPAENVVQTYRKDTYDDITL